MVYDPETDTWDAGVSAGWAEDTGDLLFNRRDGFCGY
jgi:hypothetical protein